MRRNPTVLCGCLLFALFFGTAGLLRAEVLCEEPEGTEGECGYLLIAGITEEPDPITMSGDGPQAAVPFSGFRAHVAPTVDPPQVVSHNGITVAVWAEAASGNSDIVFSEWHPGGWQKKALTFGGRDERDPRVDIADDGAIYVTWWETEAPRRVRVTRRDPESLQWQELDAFAAVNGGRPSILVLDSEVLVAFERPVGSGGQSVVVRRTGTFGWATGAIEDVLASTNREAPLIAQLHLHGDRPFIDWIHSADFYGYSEYQDGQWGASLGTRPLTQRHLAPFPDAHQRVTARRR